MEKATLKDEWNLGEVSVWSATGGIRRIGIPEGTAVLVMGRPSLDGYVLIQLGADIFEVWYENLSSNPTLN